MAETLAVITAADKRNILGIKAFGALPCTVSYVSGRRKDGVITISKNLREDQAFFIFQMTDTDEKGRFLVHPFCVAPKNKENGEDGYVIVNAEDLLGEAKTRKLISRQRVGLIFRKRKFTWQQEESPQVVELYKKMKALDHKTFEKEYF